MGYLFFLITQILIITFIRLEQLHVLHVIVGYRRVLFAIQILNVDRVISVGDAERQVGKIYHSQGWNDTKCRYTLLNSTLPKDTQL